jgi:hypothetical protein
MGGAPLVAAEGVYKFALSVGDGLGDGLPAGCRRHPWRCSSLVWVGESKGLDFGLVKLGCYWASPNLYLGAGDLR